MKERSRIIAAIGAGIFMAGVLVGLFWRDICIEYQKREMLLALEAAERLGPVGRKQSDYIEAFERHRDSLVSLGYFVRFTCHLQHVAAGTEGYRKLFRALCEKDKGRFDRAYFAMSGYDNEPKEVVVWCLPSLRHEYENVIAQYDVPER